LHQEARIGIRDVNDSSFNALRKDNVTLSGMEKAGITIILILCVLKYLLEILRDKYNASNFGSPLGSFNSLLHVAAKASLPFVMERQTCLA
jgi:hypothetical protein